MIFGDFMLGARNRLLAPGIPFPFFASAAAFQIAAWALLAIAADQLPGFVGGPGEILASLHLVTLGVVLMTAMGAALQILPVVTRHPIWSTRASRMVFWLYLPGVLALTHGMGHQQLRAMEIGGMLCVAAIVIFAVLLAHNLRYALHIRVVTEHIWVAEVALIIFAGLGLALIFDFDFGFLPVHASVAIVHGALAAYGFMGMLAFGVSFLLIPLFGLSPPPDTRNGRRAAWIITTGLCVSVTGLLYDVDPAVLTGTGIGLAGTVLHLWTMAKVMKGRMRQALGTSFVLIRVGWCLLPVSILLAISVNAGLAVEVTAPLFGFVLVFGWLLSFLMGILQRIMPFLASMHSVGTGPKPLMVSALTAERPLAAHAVGHLTGIGMVGIGIVCGRGDIIRIGAVIGLVGAMAFAYAAGFLAFQFLNRAKESDLRHGK